MAENDNLSDFLTDVADAIRSKKGTTALINPQNFSDEIASIESGGEKEEAPYNDVNFYDCDGKILHSYTWEEALALMELPPLPSRKGLICQGWNYTLDEIKSQSMCVCDVGAMYITDDDLIRIYVRIAGPNLTDGVYIRLMYAATIDWGDGTTTTPTGTASISYHTYSEHGDYVITLSKATLGASGNQGVGGIAAFIRKVECGSGISFRDYALRGAGIDCLTLPYNCYTSGGLLQSSNIKAFIFPSVSTAVPYQFARESNISKVSLPPKATNIGEYSFYKCVWLHNIRIPDGVTIIYQRAFEYCSKLNVVSIPPSVTQINNYAFGSCSSLRTVDCSRHTAIPTLGSSVFPSTSSLKIIVPDSLYDEWIAAANWSSYASRIVKASEVNN